MRKFDYSRIQDQSRKGSPEALVSWDASIRGEKKTGEQFRQSQRAHERDVQESETFGDGAEVCHGRSEGLSVR